MLLFRTRQHALRAAAAVALVMATAACATNVSRDEIVAATGAHAESDAAGGSAATDADANGGPVTIDAPDPATGAGAPVAAGSTGAPAAVAAGAPVAAAAGTTATKTGSDKSGADKAPTGSTTAGSTGATTATSTACAKPGPPIVIGQSGSFSGLVGKAVGKGRAGLSVWLADVNAHGGIACHPVRLYQSDDASNPSIGASQIQDFVQNKKAIACVGCFWPIDIAGPKSAVEKFNFPVVGGDGVPPEWNQSPVLFPLGGDSQAVIYGTVANAVKAGFKRISILTCVEASACSQAKDLLITQQLAARSGASVAYQAAISLTQTDYTAECQNSKTNNAQAIFIYADSSSMQRLARSCAGLGYTVPIIANGIAVSTDLTKDPNVVKATVFAAPGVFPWMSANGPAQQAFQAALKKYAPSLDADGSTAAAWTAGKMFEKVIQNLGPAYRDKVITTAMVFQGLGHITNETLGGLIPPVTFTPGQKHAPRQLCFYAVRLQGGVWQAPNGDKTICEPQGATNDPQRNAVSSVSPIAARAEERS